MKRILVVFGTRPEAIKMAPVVRELQARPGGFETFICVTAQHREMLDQVLRVFQLVPDFDLGVMSKEQDLYQLTSRILESMKDVVTKVGPDLVLVHGDTTTTFAAALAAFYSKFAVGHVEAGLRTGNRYAPFPEELNRRLASAIASVHFAPTDLARANLLREGVAAQDIFVTGNTIIDALRFIQMQELGTQSGINSLEGLIDGGGSLLLVTGHRRENFGAGLRNICSALVRLGQAYPTLRIVYPVHLNPNVRESVHDSLRGVPNVHLTEPLEYLPFVHLMGKATLILTDSGGIQEEAPALNKPVLVTRDVTERPEGVQTGAVKVVGTDPDRIFDEVSRLLDDASEYRRMADAPNPFGDGKSAIRIVDALENWNG